MRKLLLASLLLAGFLATFPDHAKAQEADDTASFTEISADLGSCSALLIVTGADSKPVYGAKISTRIHYGLLGVKRLDLEAITGFQGRVKITHLPEELKKPVYIHISKGDLDETVEFKPDERCHATFNVQLH